MPNWCTNRLTVRGAPDELRRFMHMAEGEEDGTPSVLLFENLFPTPDDPEVLIAEGGSRVTMRRFLVGASVNPKERYHELLETSAHDPEAKAALEMLVGELKHDWTIENWGTKWEADQPWMSADNPDDGELQYEFYTAWGPPLGVIEVAGERFPTLEFVLEYAEAGSNFSGVLTVLGDVSEDESHDDVFATEYGKEMYPDESE